MRDEVDRLQARINVKYFDLYESNWKEDIIGLYFHKEWAEGRPNVDRWEIVASRRQ